MLPGAHHWYLIYRREGDFSLLPLSPGGYFWKPQGTSRSRASRRYLVREGPRVLHLRTCVVRTRSGPEVRQRYPGSVRCRVLVTWLVQCEHPHPQIGLHREKASLRERESGTGKGASERWMRFQEPARNGKSPSLSCPWLDRFDREWCEMKSCCSWPFSGRSLIDSTTASSAASSCPSSFNSAARLSKNPARSTFPPSRSQISNASLT